jgi:hypothetical protein
MYAATVVLIEADLAPRVALPVRERSMVVLPIAPPVLADVATQPPGVAIVAGSELAVRGSGLLAPAGSATAVRFGPAELAPAAGSTAALLTVTVADSVPAGVHAVQVVHRAPPGAAGEPARVRARSNAVAVLVRPDVTDVATSASEVTLTVRPPLRAGQRSTVLLTPLGAAGDRVPLAFTLAPVAADAGPTQTVVLDRGGIADGDWLVRLIVDGADSLPRLDGGTGTYGAPLLRLA